jgi:hypothetical protein
VAKKEHANESEAGRDDFSQPTKELLARRAGYRCSICQQPTVGPHSEAGRAIFLGEAAHICSAAPNGPRANAALAAEERASASNGIHLCKVHARLVDVDVNAYPATTLKEIKTAHEKQIRALIVGEQEDFDPDFLSAHETQVIHGRGSPTLSDLWVQRHVVQPQVSGTLVKHDPISLASGESGILLLSGDQSSGRTSLLKRIVAKSLDQRNCVWLNGVDLTASAVKDPVCSLAAGHRRLNPDSECWQAFLEAAPAKNLIVIDDLHRSSLNVATKRKFLSLLQSLSELVVVTVSDPFILELLAISPNDGLRLSQWRLLDLSRTDCAHMAERWCRFGAESMPDHDLDARTASTQDQLELIFGRKLMPRHPVYVLTALQLIDAGTPMDSHVGSFGGVYETIIHFAICKNARDQAAISSERSYLQELAYYCESHYNSANRQAFNLWFAEHKGITPKRASELESAVSAKGFLARHHHGFRFNYQKHYFLAAFLRDNPNRSGVREYISKLVTNCWNEDYANTALFLAYLQPSSYLTEALLHEVRNLFVDQPEFQIAGWEIPTPFPPGFFRGLTFSTDPESNRRLLAQRLDETTPLDTSECEASTTSAKLEEDDRLCLDFIKSFHAIKLIGQLIRNSPIAFDGSQKHDLVKAGFDLSLRLVSFTQVVCSPASLQSQALNALRSRVLKKSDRVELEAKLSGLIYNLSVFLAFSPLRHACYYLAHPELTLTYNSVLLLDSAKSEHLSLKVFACGFDFELRTPNSEQLRKVYRELTPAGQDILHMWTSFFLSFNRVHVAKKQAILESVEMASNTQLLLPKGSS